MAKNGLFFLFSFFLVCNVNQHQQAPLEANFKANRRNFNFWIILGILAQTGDTFLVITRAREVESSSAAHRVKEGTELLRTNPYPVTLAKAVI